MNQQLLASNHAHCSALSTMDQKLTMDWVAPSFLTTMSLSSLGMAVSLPFMTSSKPALTAEVSSGQLVHVHAQLYNTLMQLDTHRHTCTINQSITILLFKLIRVYETLPK